MNNYKIDYDKRCLYLTYNGEDYSFHLDNGDIGDYWYSFGDEKQMYDINFHQESSECNPSLEVYKCKGIGNNLWEIDMTKYEIIPLQSFEGNPNNYFNQTKN